MGADAAATRCHRPPGYHRRTMEWGVLKPILSQLALPPAGPLLLALAALFMARRSRLAACVCGLAVAGLWAVSTPGVSRLLARSLLPEFPVVSAAQVRAAGVQAVVVLGGDVLPAAPEYGEPQPGSATTARLRYGVRLARATGLPLAFSGGLGWAGRGTATEAGAVVAAARQDFGMTLRWVDGQSRDTGENARQMARLLQPAGVKRIALVSDFWHLPRARAHFEAEGFEVLPAPTRLPLPREHPVMEWLPSPPGLDLSYRVLREWLGLRLTAPPRAPTLPPRPGA